jgi:hypothetical protein
MSDDLTLEDPSIFDSTNINNTSIPPAAPELIPDRPAVVTRSGRRVIPNQRYFNYSMHANSVFLHTFSPDNRSSEGVPLLQPDLDQHSEPHPFALFCEHMFAHSASTDPDTMTFDEAMQAPDRHEFIEAMRKNSMTILSASIGRSSL